MRVRDFIHIQIHRGEEHWKHQMLVGVLLVLTGLTILIFPPVLVALVAGAMLFAGAGLIGAAWRSRRTQEVQPRTVVMDTFDWLERMRP